MREPVVRMVEVEGLPLAVHEWAGQSAPIVLIHATGLCARTWDPVVALLPEDARVLAVDLRGHGRSGCPPLVGAFRGRQLGLGRESCRDRVGQYVWIPGGA